MDVESIDPLVLNLGGEPADQPIAQPCIKAPGILEIYVDRNGEGIVDDVPGLTLPGIRNVDARDTHVRTRAVKRRRVTLPRIFRDGQGRDRQDRQGQDAGFDASSHVSLHSTDARSALVRLFVV